MSVRKIFRQLQVFILKKLSSERKIRYLRRQGMKIGQNCHFESMDFSTEPYLVEVGDHVAIAGYTEFITHDGGIWCFREELKNADIFGKITIGNNVFIGLHCIILPNTVIGDNCIVGAGSVVRGKYPDNSVIVGNPAKIVTSLSVLKLLYLQNKGLLKTKNLSSSEKAKIIKKHFDLE